LSPEHAQVAARTAFKSKEKKDRQKEEKTTETEDAEQLVTVHFYYISSAEILMSSI
jgi:hypothetical protein